MQVKFLTIISLIDANIYVFLSTLREDTFFLRCQVRL